VNKKILTALLCCIFVFTGILVAEEATIQKGKKVKLEYTLTVDGKMIETSQGKEPLAYVHGEGQLIKGLEDQLAGEKVGAQKKVTVAPKDAYGDVLKEAVKDFLQIGFP